jgi:hypothetical protein
LRDYLDGDDWWGEVVRFLVGMYNSPKKAELWVLNTNERAKENTKTGEPFSQNRVQELLNHILETFPGSQLSIRKPAAKRETASYR